MEDKDKIEKENSINKSNSNVASALIIGFLIFLAIIGLYKREKPVSLTPTVPGRGRIDTDKYKTDCKNIILK